MISLREKLKMVKAGSSETKKPAEPQKNPLFMEENRVPAAVLTGVDRITLEEIRACEPTFTGTQWNLSDLLFLDTETTGLSGGAGTLAFEIGVGYFEQDSFVIRQYVIRDYPQEREMLEAIIALAKEHGTMVTFNGKTFDLPLIESRCIMNGLRFSFSGCPQLDLLHICRRVFKLRLGRCNLATLETAVLGTEREDDLPGAQVPQRFFDYLKTGEFGLIRDVLRHNYDDVLSMPKLLSRVAEAFRAPESLSYPEDIYGVGRTLMRGGHVRQARECYRILGHTKMAGHARLRLAESYKKDRDWEQTVSVCERMIAEGENGTWPYIELAKYYEHIQRDLDRAEQMSLRALSVLLNRMPLQNGSKERDQAEINGLYRRIERIRRKKERRDSNGTV